MTRSKLGRLAIFGVLTASLIFNGLFITIDIVPSVKSYLNKKERYLNIMNDLSYVGFDYESVIESALDMSSNTSVEMPFHEASDFISMLKKDRNHDANHKTLNYPKAFLYIGLTEYMISHPEQVSMDEVIKNFNKLIDDSDYDFEVKKIDEVPFGVALLNIYQSTGERKYKLAADKIYSYLVTEYNNSDIGLIEYRKGQGYYLLDSLGLIVPFLYKYGHMFENDLASEIARHQLQTYIKFGVDPTTALPYHAIRMKDMFPLGPNNWGRGIAWYSLAVNAYLKYDDNPQMNENFKSFFDKIEGLRDEKMQYTQFPGLPGHFDASATLPIFLMESNYYKNYNLEERLELISPFVKHGYIKYTSGDTFGINDYSKEFGRSEFSQGVLLSILSKLSN